MAKFKHKKPIAILTIVAFLLSMLPAVVFGAGTPLATIENNYLSTSDSGDKVVLSGFTDFPDVSSGVYTIKLELSAGAAVYEATYTVPTNFDINGTVEISYTQFKDSSSNNPPAGIYNLTATLTDGLAYTVNILTIPKFYVGIPAVTNVLIAPITRPIPEEMSVTATYLENNSVLAVYLNNGSSYYEAGTINYMKTTNINDTASGSIALNPLSDYKNYEIKYIDNTGKAYTLATGTLTINNPLATLAVNADGKATLTITKPETSTLYVGQSVTTIEGITDKDAVVDVYVLGNDPKITGDPYILNPVLNAEVNRTTGTFVVDLNSNAYKDLDVIFAVVASSSKGTTVKYIYHGFKFDGTQSIASPVIGQEVKLSGVVTKYNEQTAKYEVATSVSLSPFEVYYSNGNMPYQNVTDNNNII